MTDLGEALDASSGCKNIQTTEASKEEQAQPPCTSWHGQGEFTDFEQNGKKKKTTQATDQGWPGPNQESSQEGLCDPTMGSLVPLQCLDLEQEYNRAPPFISKA